MTTFEIGPTELSNNLFDDNENSDDDDDDDDSNSTRGWSAALNASDAPQLSEPGCMNSTRGWSAALNASDALLLDEPGCTESSHDVSERSSLIRRGPSVSHKWAALAPRPAESLSDLELLLLREVGADCFD